jgi:hypothetical protein
MPDTVIVSLTITRMLRAGFVPWMYQLTLDHASKCMTWQISFEYMPNEAISESPTSYSMGEFALEYSTGDGVSTVALIHTDSTCT